MSMQRDISLHEVPKEDVSSSFPSPSSPPAVTTPLANELHETIDAERTAKLSVGFISYSDSLLARSVNDMGYALVMIAAYVIITVVFMMVQVEEGLLDACLTAVTTATTAGCGDVRDLSKMERLVSTFLVILGVGVAGGAIAIFFSSLRQVDQYAATRQLMRKNQARGKATAVIPASLNQLSFYERCAVRYYKVSSIYYKGKKKLTRFLLSWGWFRTHISSLDNEVGQSMKAELDEFFVHQLLDLVFFLLLLLFLISLSAGIMHHVEEWNYVDSFYWSVTTISTGGIEQFKVETTGGKEWMIVYIIIGSTTFFFAWFKILYIPIANSEKRTQLEVLNQFSGQLSYATVHKLMHNDFFENIPDLKTDSEEIQKGEFVLMVLFLMNKISYNDVKLGLQVFESLDKISAGAPMAGVTPTTTATGVSFADTNGPPDSPTGSAGAVVTALNQSDVMQALSSQFELAMESATSNNSTVEAQQQSSRTRSPSQSPALFFPSGRNRRGTTDLSERLLDENESSS